LRCLVFEKSVSDPVRVGSVEPGPMLATIGDLLADRMEPIQRVEKEERLSGKRMRGCGK